VTPEPNRGEAAVEQSEAVVPLEAVPEPPAQRDAAPGQAAKG
jgi:hypothetical protein